MSHCLRSDVAITRSLLGQQEEKSHVYKSNNLSMKHCVYSNNSYTIIKGMFSAFRWCLSHHNRFTDKEVIVHDFCDDQHGRMRWTLNIRPNFFVCEPIMMTKISKERCEHLFIIVYELLLCTQCFMLKIVAF